MGTKSGSGIRGKHPESDFFPTRISDPYPHQLIQVFLTQKTDNKFSERRSEMFIPDPGSGFFPSRIQGEKATDPGYATFGVQYCFPIID
jgi:hypothetical protein